MASQYWLLNDILPRAASPVFVGRDRDISGRKWEIHQSPDDIGVGREGGHLPPGERERVAESVHKVAFFL